ncbi:MAG: type III-B CRISPR module RAMP protein Cmr6 [Chloroflexi bacterium]|nr:type III-B CRISPR module RAMP protein Cmr6 [Chloroflexota bacterium]
MSDRRGRFEDIEAQSTTHAGLWLDKFIAGFERQDGSPPQGTLVKEVSRISEPKPYVRFFQRWKEALRECGVKEEHLREAKALGRLAVGLGGEAVLETAITLHHTYGVPYIPGSALKGLAASYARRRLEGDEWSRNGWAYQAVFGDTDEAGYVTFFDALYVPGSGHKGKALWPDVITVHHREYYSGEKKPPADWDSPNPVPFLSATGRYLVALQGDDAWVEKVFDILGHALMEEGIGARTSSGYGRMTLETGSSSVFAFRPGETYELARLRLLRREAPPPGRYRGTVVRVREEGRYGFIRPAHGGKDMFVHVSQLVPPIQQLREGQVVEYKIGKHEGRDQAQDVEVLLERDT